MSQFTERGMSKFVREIIVKASDDMPFPFNVIKFPYYLIVSAAILYGWYLEKMPLWLFFIFIIIPPIVRLYAAFYVVKAVYMTETKVLKKDLTGG